MIELLADATADTEMEEQLKTVTITRETANLIENYLVRLVQNGQSAPDRIWRQPLLAARRELSTAIGLADANQPSLKEVA